jgi:hypothetical protein
MLQCATCDSLFENGFIAIRSDGALSINRNKATSSNLDLFYSKIEGKKIKYANGNINRIKYLHYHWMNTFKGENYSFEVSS